MRVRVIRPRALLVLSLWPTLLGADDLSAAARSAAEAIRRHQQHPGYWLTSFTAAAKFQDAQPEMNTYLTSVMVDMLDPIAVRARLAQTVSKARRHLWSQIEETGLVRYHGRPGSAAIRAALGCAITPDSDDTVLVWRIAPSPDRNRLARALEVLKRYRTAEGLYQTWLAPRSEFACLDPGTDPNPPDSGIQAHTYLLLAREDPAAARQLCVSLQKTIALEKIWVYNRQAPLEVILRRQQMADVGCPLEIPEGRLSTPVPGQQVWLDAARLFERLTSARGVRPVQSEVRELLQTLSSSGFSLLRGAPPLLYHNDLSAHVSRFYWSEDFGYALWLRLYIENARRSGIKG